jgi:hypothetical protein
MRFSGAGGTVADPGVPSPPRAGLHDLRGRLNEIREGRSLLEMAAGSARKEKRR